MKTPSIWELDELRRELRQMLRVASSSIKRHLGACVQLTAHGMNRDSPTVTKSVFRVTMKILMLLLISIDLN